MVIRPTAFATTMFLHRAPIILKSATDHWCTKKSNNKNMKTLYNHKWKPHQGFIFLLFYCLWNNEEFLQKRLKKELYMHVQLQHTLFLPGCNRLTSDSALSRTDIPQKPENSKTKVRHLYTDKVTSLHRQSETFAVSLDCLPKHLIQLEISERAQKLLLTGLSETIISHLSILLSLTEIQFTHYK